MSAWGCCGEYNDHHKDCVFNEDNPNSYKKVIDERDSLRALLAAERDEFGKKETELKTEVEKLKKDGRESCSKHGPVAWWCSGCTYEEREKLTKDRDHWRTLAERMAEALKTIKDSGLHSGHRMGEKCVTPCPHAVAKNLLAAFESGKP